MVFTSGIRIHSGLFPIRKKKTVFRKMIRVLLLINRDVSEILVR